MLPPAAVAAASPTVPPPLANPTTISILQLPGLENCLHELLLERARHLTAMESLTSQLRRREAEATKHDHDVKALAARLECTEQDKSALERRARAAAEEHRVERARWFVHKQVCVRHVVCFGRDAADLRSFFENETGGAGGGGSSAQSV